MRFSLEATEVLDGTYYCRLHIFVIFRSIARACGTARYTMRGSGSKRADCSLCFLQYSYYSYYSIRYLLLYGFTGVLAVVLRCLQRSISNSPGAAASTPRSLYAADLNLEPSILSRTLSGHRGLLLYARCISSHTDVK